MGLTMYEIAVPSFKQRLSSLSSVLDKAIIHCEERKIDPTELAESRLAPDMFNLSQQVQRASVHAGGAVARLADIEVPKFTDDETNLVDLKHRLADTLKFIESVSPEMLDGSESRTITVEVRIGTLTFSGQDYLIHFALPQVYFHVTTAYDILRHKGLEIGKRDYLGKATTN
ncbi:DUF1993 family protein [Pseudomonadota bacterium]